MGPDSPAGHAVTLVDGVWGRGDGVVPYGSGSACRGVLERYVRWSCDRRCQTLGLTEGFDTAVFVNLLADELLPAIKEFHEIFFGEAEKTF